MLPKSAGMMPKVKHYEDKGQLGRIAARIQFGFQFANAANAFCSYAEEDLGVSFLKDDGGITLMYQEQLGKEAYTIDCTENSMTVCASSYKGMSNALSCVLSLLTADGKGGLTYACCRIEDEPDIAFRTFMLDTARYPHKISYLYRYVDLCYKNRLSYLQLHLADDQNFTLQLSDYPLLNGAYSREELSALADYADYRGITVIPEIDVPGHSELITSVYPEVFGSNGIMCADETTFSALEKIFAELHEIFPHSPYIHVGGDEAKIANWETCERSLAYMKAHGITSIHELYAEYIRRVTEMVLALGCTPIVWEGFSEEFNDRISKDVLVVAWESYYQTADQLVKAGFKIINASWKPLYILVNTAVQWPPEKILDWNIRSWYHWMDMSKAYPNGIFLKEDEGDVVGAYLCAWGDGFKKKRIGMKDPDALCEKEFELVAARMPYFSEQTWNALKK